MTDAQIGSYCLHVKKLIAEKSQILPQAQALVDMGLPDFAQPLWKEVASDVERLSPPLETTDHLEQRAIHEHSL